MIRKIAILTEGGSDKGFGHITRCLALSQYKDFMPLILIRGDKNNNMWSFIQHNPCIFMDWINDPKVELILNTVDKFDAIFIDSYFTTPDFYERIKHKAKVLVCLDDTERIEYPDNTVIWNGGISAKEMYYPRSNKKKYLLGSDFAPMRKDFWEVPPFIVKDEIRNVLITCGGMSHFYFISQLVERLKKTFPDLNCHVVIPASDKDLYDNVDELDDVTLYCELTAKDIKKLMYDSDVCISGGGQTLYELARVGIPTIGICLADNQIPNLKGWTKCGFLEYAGRYVDAKILEQIESAMKNLVAPATRQERMEIAREIIDGRGIQRVGERVVEIMDG
jgi:UDP-2,4-diacetamido-2,4,6-trideoxy-beta-L-altropyranose hydrolase